MSEIHYFKRVEESSARSYKYHVPSSYDGLKVYHTDITIQNPIVNEAACRDYLESNGLFYHLPILHHHSYSLRIRSKCALEIS